MKIQEYHNFEEKEIRNLYVSVGWKNYTDRPNMLLMAYKNSPCILGAYEEDKLIGIIRVVGDGASIVFIQDILVLPKYQHQGIGTALVKEIMNRYRSVYQIQLMTDNTEKTIAFYKSLGFFTADDVACCAFLKM